MHKRLLLSAATPASSAALADAEVFSDNPLATHWPVPGGVVVGSRRRRA